MMACLLLTEEERKKTIRTIVCGSILIGLLFFCEWTDPKPVETTIALRENASEAVAPGHETQVKDSQSWLQAYFSTLPLKKSTSHEAYVENYKREKIRRMMIDMDKHPMRYYYDDMTKPCLDY